MKVHVVGEWPLVVCEAKFMATIRDTIILLIQLSDWFYSLKHSEITQNKIKQFYYDKTMVNFFKVCDVHMFFVE